MCEVLSVKRVKTRKPHRCWGCQRVVPVGTEIECVVSVDMGKAESAYWCDDCGKAQVAQGDGEACYGEGDFREDLREAGIDLSQPVAQ